MAVTTSGLGCSSSNEWCRKIWAQRSTWGHVRAAARLSADRTEPRAAVFCNGTHAVFRLSVRASSTVETWSALCADMQMGCSAEKAKFSFRPKCMLGSTVWSTSRIQTRQPVLHDITPWNCWSRTVTIHSEIPIVSRTTGITIRLCMVRHSYTALISPLTAHFGRMWWWE